MKVKVLKFTKNHEFHGNTEMGVFHGRRPISRKMSRPWNRELGWSLVIAVKQSKKSTYLELGWNHLHLSIYICHAMQCNIMERWIQHCKRSKTGKCMNSMT